MFHRSWRSDCDVEPFFKIIVCCQCRTVYSDLIFAWFARLRDPNFKMRDSETRFIFSSLRFRDSSLRRRDFETRRKFAETHYFSRTILYPYYEKGVVRKPQTLGLPPSLLIPSADSCSGSATLLSSNNATSTLFRFNISSSAEINNKGGITR